MKPETLRDTRIRARRARRFPTNTCPASRHLHLLADTLASGKIPVQFAEDPKHCAQSIYAALAALWELRAAKAEGSRTTICDGISQQKEIG